MPQLALDQFPSFVTPLLSHYFILLLLKVHQTLRTLKPPLSRTSSLLYMEHRPSLRVISCKPNLDRDILHRIVMFKNLLTLSHYICY